MKRVRAIAFKQKTTTLYCFTMSAMELEPLCYVEAATRDNKKGLQRLNGQPPRALGRVRESDAVRKADTWKTSLPG